MNKNSVLNRWVVSVDGIEVGLVEKFKANKSDLHPFKAYKGIGQACTLVGFFYDDAEAGTWPHHEGMVLGGFDAAVKAAIS